MVCNSYTDSLLRWPQFCFKLSCGMLIVKTCYPQASCKLIQQVLICRQMTSCNKPDFNRLVAIWWNWQICCNLLTSLQCFWSCVVLTNNAEPTLPFQGKDAKLVNTPDEKDLLDREVPEQDGEDKVLMMESENSKRTLGISRRDSDKSFGKLSLKLAKLHVSYIYMFESQSTLSLKDPLSLVHVLIKI